MPVFPAVVVPRRHASAPYRALRRFARWLALCHARAAQRRHLAELDARMLKDVGITPRAAAAESAKPWWRA